MNKLFENWRKHTIQEKAELKIPVERYDAFKRKIEQWGMLFNKFTGYTRDLNNQSFDRKTDGKRIIRMAGKLEREFRKIMDEFDFEAKVYDDERYAMRQKLDQFDGDSEFFLEEMEGLPQADSFSDHLSLSKSIRDAIIGHLENEKLFEMGAIPQSVIRVVENSSLRVANAVKGEDQ